MNNPVLYKYNDSEIEEVVIKPLALSWDKFSDEIKNVNRFHFVNSLDLEKLKSLFKNFEKEIIRGKKFYRARICENKDGYQASEMGNPPAHLTKSGRANPEGISYLYLANDTITTLYEVRASLFDYVSVGTFRLEDNIKIINLSQKTYDIFRLSEMESLDEVIIHKLFIEKLEKELSKPRRRSDSELDYLPTQYLSELIKSMGYDGIEFSSSLYESGLNLVIFNPEKLRCIDVKLYDIENISLQYIQIDSK
ncbi:RES family NAD+ phosphorylase [Capnocytophaga canimorsus]|uniref:RES family NAD+ phosphorylase n=1 Tax=Capnocytophaga canimorsus TaxID=28188 RepID=UPI0037D8B268